MYCNKEIKEELTYGKVLELFAESNRRYQEQRVESDKRIEKVNKELSRKISNLDDTLGRFAEEQVRADLLTKFEKWGIPVHAITNHFTQRDHKNEYAYEVIILIYNSKYVVAIEVKNTLKKDHVDEYRENA